MKKVLFIILLLAFSISCGNSVHETESQNEKQALQEIMQMERRLLVSIKRKDKEALKEIWDDKYLGIAPTGTFVTRHDLIAGIESGIIELEDIKFRNLKLRLFGDIGIVTGMAEVKGKVDTQDISRSYTGTGIFIKREDGWHPVGVHVGLTDWMPDNK